MLSFDQTQQNSSNEDTKTEDDIDVRKTRACSVSSQDKVGEEVHGFVNEEEDTVNAGWKVLLKYFKVSLELKILKKFLCSGLPEQFLSHVAKPKYRLIENKIFSVCWKTCRKWTKNCFKMG